MNESNNSFSKKVSNKFTKILENFEIEDVEKHIIKGVKANSLSKYNKAITYFQKAIKIDSSNIESYLGLGFAYYKLNKFNDSVECYQKVVMLDPNDAYGYYCME